MAHPFPAPPSVNVPPATGWRNAVTALVAAGCVAVAAAAADGPTLCPWRRCTGLACPGCGLSRAGLSLLRGDLSLSLRYHPLAIVLGLQAAAIAVPGGSRSWMARHATTLLTVNAVVLVVVWLLRWRLGLLDFVLAS